MGIYSGGLIIGSIFASEIWGAYFQEDFFWEGAYRNFTVFCFMLLTLINRFIEFSGYMLLLLKNLGVRIRLFKLILEACTTKSGSVIKVWGGAVGEKMDA